MKYGQELIEMLEKEIANYAEVMADRQRRINAWETDEDDCFISQRCDERGINLAKDKIALIKDGGCMWFPEYATLDGILIKARWCNTKYGYSLRAEMPDGSVLWTTADTKKGLAKKGIKKVMCKRPAWFAFHSSQGGMMGVYTGSYVPFPSDFNYATGESASVEPVEIEDCE